MQAAKLSRREAFAGAAALALTAALPARAQAAPELNFLVVGDWGRKGGRLQRAVAAGMAARARQIGGQFVVTAGDNFYGQGVAGVDDPHWRRSFLDIYDPNALPIWYAALGNHDYNGDPQAQIAFSGLEQRWRMPARYYRQSFNIGTAGAVDLFVLDTSPMAEPLRYRRPLSELRAQWEWFDREASASRADWKIVIGHHPLHSSGWKPREYPYLRRWLTPRLELYGVHAYVAGHDHHLEHIQRGGVAHIVSGGGSEGEPLAGRLVTGHRQGWASPGFTSFQISDAAMTIGFIDPAGATLGSTRIDRRVQARRS